MSAPARTGAAAPRTVNIAYWLFLLVALFHVVALIISAATFNGQTAAAKAQLSKTGANVSSSTANSIFGASLVVAIVIGIAFVVVFVLFDVFMRRGANWARVVLTILTVLSVTGIAGAYGVGAISVVAAIVATVLMYLRPSNEYFRQAKLAKMGAPAVQR